MSVRQVEMTGTVRPDGVLELDGPVALGPGRVTVTVRPLQPEQQQPELPKDDPFWQRMKAIWAIPRAVDDGGENTLEEVKRAREEWDEHQQTLERLQDESRARMPPSEESRP